jgi:hypothetical protein
MSLGQTGNKAMTKGLGLGADIHVHAYARQVGISRSNPDCGTNLSHQLSNISS